MSRTFTKTAPKTENKAYQRDGLIHQIFAAQARFRPEAIALEKGDEQLSYGELEQRANQLAVLLQERGVTPGSMVGVSLPRDFELIVTLLAVLKCGAAYVPLDPEHPPTRTQVMAQTAGLHQVIAGRHSAEMMRKRLPEAHVFIPGEYGTTAPASSAVNAWALSPAYVMFTSGSTGKPKGVSITHRALVHAHHIWEEGYRLSQTASCHLQMANFAFDVFFISAI